MPKISVLMSVYNHEAWLKKSIESIIYQTFSDFELIIINDGSTDGSLNIIKSYNDCRIKLISNEKKLGLPKSLNRGLKICKSKIIARMDADDISMKNRLEKQFKYLKKNKDVDVLGGQVLYIDKKGKKMDFSHEYPISNHIIKWEMLREVPLCHPSVMFRKNVLTSAGLYSEDYPYAQDYELWKRIADCGCKFSNLSDKIIYYRIKNKEKITAKIKKQKKAHLRILYDALSYYLPIEDYKLVHYYYYGPKKPLNDKNMLMMAVKLTLEIYRNFILSNQLSKSEKFIISQDTALKILNFAKIQKHLSLIHKIYIMYLGSKICKKILLHYQFRKTLSLLF